MQVRVKFPSGDVIGSEMQRLDVKRALSRKRDLMVTFELTQKTALSVAFDVTIRGDGGGEPYDGPYTVTPGFETQGLPQRTRF